MSYDTQRRLPLSRKAARLIVLVNFGVFLALVVPPVGHLINRGFWALRAISPNLEDVVGYSLQIWLVGSTLLAAVLFARIAWKTRRAQAGGPAGPPLLYDAVLLIVWWLVVLGACAYAFMLGMGG